MANPFERLSGPIDQDPVRRARVEKIKLDIYDILENKPTKTDSAKRQAHIGRWGGRLPR